MRAMPLPRSGRGSIATARLDGWMRIHSMPMLPSRAPTSHSSCAGDGRERRQGQRPDLALGELAVLLVRVVRQPGGARQRRGVLVEAALDRDDRQAAVRRAVRARGDALAGAAQVGEDGDRA